MAEISVYYGKIAATTFFNTRPNDIKKVYVSDKKGFVSIIDWCKRKKIFFKRVSTKKLSDICGSVHHGGIVIFGVAVKILDEKTFFEKLNDLSGPQRIIYLDNIGNPHNVGFILRTAAHFGVNYVITESKKNLSPSAYRVSEGAAEFVKLVRTSDAVITINSLKEFGFKCFSSSSHEGENIYKTRFPRRVVLIIGNEESGINKNLLDISDSILSIPGSGKIESLNVSVACGIILGEIYSQHTL